MQTAMRRIGLIGGVTWAASAEYYRRINHDVKRRLGGHHSAEMVLRSLDLHPLLERAEDIAQVSEVFAAAARDLSAAGAELLAIASFTGHRYAGALSSLPLPFIELTASVAARLRSAGHRRVAVWATSYALRDEALMTHLTEASGASLMLPPPDLYAQLDRIIFEELSEQRLRPASLAWLQGLLADSVAAGAQALLLATTDLSPVASALRGTLPLLDATEIHCAALVDAALD